MDVQFGIKPKFVVFDLISPPLVQILPALDKDNGLDLYDKTRKCLY